MSYKKILLFPGETCDFNRNLLPYNVFSYKPHNSNKDIKNNQLVSKKSSLLDTSSKKNKSALYIGKIYTPSIDDVVIGTITLKQYDQYKVDINTSRDASLGLIEFEGATKKTKPNLIVGDVLFCRVVRDNKFDSTILSCKSFDNVKNWSSGESTFGQLTGGNVYELNRLHCWWLINDNAITERIRDYVEYEMCIGMNGRIWIKAEKEEDCDKIYDVLRWFFESEAHKREIERKINQVFNYDEQQKK